MIPIHLAQAQIPETSKTPGGSNRARFEFENDVVEVVNEAEGSMWTNVTYAQKAGAKTKDAADALTRLLRESKSRSETQKDARNDKAKTKVIYGSAKPDTEEVNLAADVSLVAFNVNKTCSKDHMRTFLC